MPEPQIIKESTLFELQMLLNLIETLEKQIEEVEFKILIIWDSVKDRYFTQTITGLGDIRVATICAEIGNVDDFTHPDKILAFAGLDPKVTQSGNKEIIRGPNKRGSKMLRWALGWAVVEAKRTNPVIGSFFQKKLDEGKHFRPTHHLNCSKGIEVIH